MPFSLEITSEFEEQCKKAVKKNNELRKVIENKVKEILEDPFRFKPLHKPLQGFRRVHIMKSFVLIYFAKKREQIVVLTKFEHHDKAYKV